MKKIFCVLVLLTSLFISSQNQICGEIIYRSVINFDYEYSEDYKMVFTKDWSYSEEINIRSTKNTNKTFSSEKGTTNAHIVGRKNTTSKFYYNKRNSFFFRDNFYNKIFIVKEDVNFQKWEIINESKTIGNFYCKKAITNFRGRNYTAWFTEEINVPFGPWKMKGLPGLILEIYDEDEVFHIYPKKITLKNIQCNINLPDYEVKKAIELTDYRKEKEKIVDDIFRKLSAKRPKGAKPIKRDKNCEDCKGHIEIFNKN